MVGIDDLPPAPRRQRETGGSDQGNQRADVVSESQFAAELAAEEVGFQECIFKIAQVSLIYCNILKLQGVLFSWSRPEKL